MNPRQRIITLLKMSSKPMAATAVHDAIERSGFERSDSIRRLSELVAAGVVIRHDDMYSIGAVPKNNICELCKKHSRVYQMIDRPLQGVRV